MNHRVPQARVLWLLCLALIAGCGGAAEDDQPDLGVVKGVVLQNGKPLANVQVRFTPEEGRPSIGITDAEGRYELTYIRDIPGAKIGQHVVDITTVTPPQTDRDGGKPVAEKIPPQFNRKTTLKKDVVAGENTIDFPLKF